MKYIFIAIAIIIVVAIVGFSLNKSTDTNQDIVTQINSSNLQDDKSVSEEESQDKQEDIDTNQPIETAEPAASGDYIDYQPSLLAKANDGDVVLFFHASWCPTCKALDASLNREFSDIPSDLTILKVNYDTEAELKKKYSIAYQHTLVQVDAQGNEINKWTGGNDLASITKRLK